MLLKNSIVSFVAAALLLTPFLTASIALAQTTNTIHTTSLTQSQSAAIVELLQSFGVGSDIILNVQAILNSTTVRVPFAIGSTVEAIASLNVRTQGSITATKLCTKPLGTVGNIIKGPVQANGYTWWDIDYVSTCRGWSIQNAIKIADGTLVIKKSYTPTPTPMITPNTTLPTVTLGASNQSIQGSYQTSITYSVTNADSCTSDFGATPIPPKGSFVVSSAARKTYTITCKSQYGSGTGSISF